MLIAIAQADEADVDPIEIAQPVEHLNERYPGPPLATVVRRVKSYGDTQHPNSPRRELAEYEEKPLRARKGVKSELEFDNWYNEFSQTLVDSTHDRYQYATSNCRASQDIESSSMHTG